MTHLFHEQRPALFSDLHVVDIDLHAVPNDAAVGQPTRRWRDAISTHLPIWLTHARVSLERLYRLERGFLSGGERGDPARPRPAAWSTT